MYTQVYATNSITFFPNSNYSYKNYITQHTESNLSNSCRILRASLAWSLMKSTTKKAAQAEGTKIWPQ